MTPDLGLISKDITFMVSESSSISKKLEKFVTSMARGALKSMVDSDRTILFKSLDFNLSFRHFRNSWSSLT